MEIITQKKSYLKKAIIAVIILILMIISFGAGLYLPGRSEVIREIAKKETVYLGKILGKYNQPQKGQLSQDINFNLFWDVWDALKKDYVDKDKLNEKEMFYGAIKGMVAATGDPYTVFMDPKIAQDFANDLAGTFEGIGAEIGIRKDILTIISPLADSPAEKAGLKAGDKILAINGTSTMGITVDEAVNKIRGQKGTKVKLTIMREGVKEPKEIEITRDTIMIKSVKTEIRPDKIMVIKISNFNDDTNDLFNKAVEMAVKDNPAGIIIDLRNDPGGYLETAIDVASKWIDSGIVVSEQFADGKKNDFYARGRAALKNFKTVVLINQGSASASEIVSGALKDYGKATLVGKKSFGKGSVQTLEQMKDGSELKVTIAKWLTPKGYNINEQGIQPDFEVELKDEDVEKNKDPQMDKAVDLIFHPVAKDKK